MSFNNLPREVVLILLEDGDLDTGDILALTQVSALCRGVFARYAPSILKNAIEPSVLHHALALAHLDTKLRALDNNWSSSMSRFSLLPSQSGGFDFPTDVASLIGILRTHHSIALLAKSFSEEAVRIISLQIPSGETREWPVISPTEQSRFVFAFYRYEIYRKVTARLKNKTRNCEWAIYLSGKYGPEKTSWPITDVAGMVSAHYHLCQIVAKNRQQMVKNLRDRVLNARGIDCSAKHQLPWIRKEGMRLPWLRQQGMRVFDPNKLLGMRSYGANLNWQEYEERAGALAARGVNFMANFLTASLQQRQDLLELENDKSHNLMAEILPCYFNQGPDGASLADGIRVPYSEPYATTVLARSLDGGQTLSTTSNLLMHMACPLWDKSRTRIVWVTELFQEVVYSEGVNEATWAVKAAVDLRGVQLTENEFRKLWMELRASNWLKAAGGREAELSAWGLQREILHEEAEAEDMPTESERLAQVVSMRRRRLMPWGW